MVMCISGNVTFDDAVQLVEKWFGDIKPRATALRHLPIEPAQTQPRVLKAHRDVPENMIMRIYHMCGVNDKDFVASDLLSDVLANGTSARFHRNVMMKYDLFSDLDAVIVGSNDPGLLYITARLSEGADAQQAIDVVDAELGKLHAEGVTERGLFYGLESGILASGFPLGVSNHFTGEKAEISVENGSLLVLWDRNCGFPRRERGMLW